MIFPITTNNASKHKSFAKNENYNNNKPLQTFNLIPIYKNISAMTSKTKPFINKTPDIKIKELKSEAESGFNTPNDYINFNSQSPNNDFPGVKNTVNSIRENKSNSNNIANAYANNHNNKFNNIENIYYDNNFTNFNDCSSDEKKIRIPLQRIHNTLLSKNAEASAKLNYKKSLNFSKLLNSNGNNLSKPTSNSKSKSKDRNYSNASYKEEKTNFKNFISNNKKEEKCENNSNIYKADLDKVRISKKSFGCIEGYAAITTEGIVRGYNEDRVSIILNIPQPPNYKGNNWPKCSFFGIYDGHGGSACADFLRDNLHKFVK